MHGVRAQGAGRRRHAWGGISHRMHEGCSVRTDVSMRGPVGIWLSTIHADNQMDGLRNLYLHHLWIEVPDQWPYLLGSQNMSYRYGYLK